ncbi:MAG: outer membrane beta-barrel protein [Bacteroidota bacterium]|nr:outer membrane beta-barrel protein [Bacteroidota bacterium]
MKRLTVLLASLMLLASTNVFAQSKGGVWIDGGLSFSSYSGETGNIDKLGNSSFGINLSGNYMITDKFSAGLGLGYDMSSADYTTELCNKQNMFTVTLQGHYFMKLNKLFTWTPRIYAYYGFGTYTHETALKDVDSDLSKMGIMVEPLNFQANFTKNFAITFACDLATFGYSSTKTSLDDVDDKDNNFTFKLGNYNSLLGDLGLRLGFRYFF